jgi:hypothetical protein
MLDSGFDQLLEAFVVDVYRCPLGHLVAREVLSKLHVDRFQCVVEMLVC